VEIEDVAEVNLSLYEELRAQIEHEARVRL